MEAPDVYAERETDSNIEPGEPLGRTSCSIPPSAAKWSASTDWPSTPTRPTRGIERLVRDDLRQQLPVARYVDFEERSRLLHAQLTVHHVAEFHRAYVGGADRQARGTVPVAGEEHEIAAGTVAKHDAGPGVQRNHFAVWHEDLTGRGRLVVLQAEKQQAIVVESNLQDVHAFGVAEHGTRSPPRSEPAGRRHAARSRRPSRSSRRPTHRTTTVNTPGAPPAVIVASEGSADTELSEVDFAGPLMVNVDAVDGLVLDVVTTNAVSSALLTCNTSGSPDVANFMPTSRPGTSTGRGLTRARQQAKPPGSASADRDPLDAGSWSNDGELGRIGSVLVHGFGDALVAGTNGGDVERSVEAGWLHLNEDRLVRRAHLERGAIGARTDFAID